MWRIDLIVLTILSVTFTSCEKEEIATLQTGLKATIKYGVGDCFPVIDESRRDYKDYNGDIYLIVKSDLEHLGNPDFDLLKANSIKKNIANGKLEIELPIDTFLVLPAEVYLGRA